jgi:hypothetical protein
MNVACKDYRFSKQGIELMSRFAAQFFEERSLSKQFSIRCGAFLFCLLAVGAQIPAYSHNQSVQESIVVPATTQFIYRAIQKARNTGGSRKLVSYKNNQAVVEELFDGLPLIGTANCTYKEVETSPTRIDYSLLRSDKLARFDGAWILTAENDGRTKITLSSTTVCGIHLPFADKLTAQAALKRIERRLQEIAGVAITEQRLAVAQETCLVARSLTVTP